MAKSRLNYGGEGAGESGGGKDRKLYKREYNSRTSTKSHHYLTITSALKIIRPFFFLVYIFIGTSIETVPSTRPRWQLF